MASGFIYILLNPSFPDQIKIGRTEKSSGVRAKQLWSTGVPTPFIVVYDELVSDCIEVEKRLHTRFEGYRVHNSREFFRIPVREAIQALQNEASSFQISTLAQSNRTEILTSLKSKYEKYLKPDIVSVAFVQIPDVCFLEITRRSHPHLRDEIVERIDLSIISNDKGDMFPPSDTIEANASRFINDLDEYSIIMTTPLFSEEGAQKVANEWEKPGG